MICSIWVCRIPHSSIVQINHEPACIAGRSVSAHLVANCLVEMFGDRVRAGDPILDKIEPPAGRIAIFLAKFAVAVRTGQLDLVHAVADSNEPIGPRLVLWRETNLISANLNRELGEHIGVMKKLESRPKEEIWRRASCTERLPIVTERTHGPPCSEVVAGGATNSTLEWPIRSNTPI
jgi:hypothetical protein